MTTVTAQALEALEDGGDSKDRLIDALQAQLREAREEIAERGVRLTVTEAKLDESRRALYECMGVPVMTLEPLALIDTAAAYAGKAGRELALSSEPGCPDGGYHVDRAQIYGGLALAAATLEAAADRAELASLRRLGAEMARLNEAMAEDQYAPYYCSREWADEEAVIPSQVDDTDLRAHDGKPHRCTMAHPHPNDPHYCKCGSEL